MNRLPLTGRCSHETKEISELEQMPLVIDLWFLGHCDRTINVYLYRDLWCFGRRHRQV